MPAALTEAGKAFTGKEGAVNRIIMVSDGIETCEGDPVTVAEQLHKQGFAVVIDVIGFDVKEGSADAEQLRRIAEVGGGKYYSARTGADIDEYFKQQSQAIGQTWDAAVCELRNGFHMSLCDSIIVNKATGRIRTLRDTGGGGLSKEQEKAYDDLSERIRAAQEQREAVRKEAMARSEQLQEQAARLRAQIKESYSTVHQR